MLKDPVVTRSYLDKKLSQYKDELKGELKEELKDELGGDIKNELYGIKDEIVGEIKALREEFDAHQSSHRRINNELQNHEKRIKKFESRMHA